MDEKSKKKVAKSLDFLADFEGCVFDNLGKLEEKDEEIEKSLVNLAQDFQEALQTIELTPGPQGKEGARGEKGERGPQGERGEKGEKGATGPTGLQGIQGRDGQDGQDGKDGKDGQDGQDYFSTPEDIKNKLESLKGEKRLDASAIKNLPKSETRSLFGSPRYLKVKSDGRLVGDVVDTINFTGQGVSLSQNDRLITVTISGGGGSDFAIPQLASDPVSPKAEDAWVLRSGDGGSDPIPDGTPMGLLLALTYTDNAGGTPFAYQFSYYTQEGTIKRVNLT